METICVWICMDTYGLLWVCMDVWIVWIIMVLYGFVWIVFVPFLGLVRNSS